MYIFLIEDFVHSAYPSTAHEGLLHVVNLQLVVQMHCIFLQSLVNALAKNLVFCKYIFWWFDG